MKQYQLSPSIHSSGDDHSDKENDARYRTTKTNVLYQDVNAVTFKSLPELVPRSIQTYPPLKILFLSSDTGGGHRASAEALAAQFQRLYPGSTYDLLDIVKDHGAYPFNGLESWYPHLSRNPSQWHFVYQLSNHRAFESMSKIYMNIMTERAVRKRIQSYGADVVISVHPLMTNVPMTSCAKISSETGKHLPFFTVVTDLGSGHCTWFANGVEKMFIASESIRKLAIERGHVPESKLVESGLPIRFDFAVEAERLGGHGRVSFVGKKYQSEVKSILGLESRNTVLIMGGGDGLGRLTDIVKKLYLEGTRRKISLSIIVICGRNGALRNQLEKFDWDELRAKDRRLHEVKKEQDEYMRACMQNPFKILHRKTNEPRFIPFDVCGKAAAHVRTDCVYYDPATSDPSSLSIDLVELPQKVTVVPLGFVSNIAQYMVASDILVTKAGPGTIAEAAAVGLPVLLTSFLPGQEEGNVDFVVNKGFGSFQEDKNSEAVASIVCNWLQDPNKLNDMSFRAHQAGSPRAAEDIARVIGESVVRWKELNDA